MHVVQFLSCSRCANVFCGQAEQSSRADAKQSENGLSRSNDPIGHCKLWLSPAFDSKQVYTLYNQSHKALPLNSQKPFLFYW